MTVPLPIQFSRPADYVKCGLRLIPIPCQEKRPNTQGWQLRANVISDPVIAENLSGNIGLAHAYCEPFPTAALDIDDLIQATAWLEDRGVDLVALLDADDAVLVSSGRPTRAKALFRLPQGSTPLLTVQIKNSYTREMILEFRCATADGHTVQDLIPPSTHPNTGQPYQWGGRGRWQDLPTIPQSLEAVWKAEIEQRAKGRDNSRGCRPRHAAIDDTPRKRATVVQMLHHISADCSYDVYRNIVWAILSLGWHDGEGMAEDWCKTAPDRFDERSFRSIVSGYDEGCAPTFGTISHHARLGGWND